MKKKLDIYGVIGLWFQGIVAILAGMTWQYYAWEPEWWPAFLNNPGVCATWLGVIIMSVVGYIMFSAYENLKRES